jgi:hypothetical protein
MEPAPTRAHRAPGHAHRKSSRHPRPSPRPITPSRGGVKHRGELSEDRKDANEAISRFRARMEHIIAHLKNWKILSHRYRGPLEKIGEVIRTVVGPHFFRYA